MEWWQEHSWALWLVLALTLGVVETATVDFVFVMFAGGALAGAGTAALGVAFPGQVVAAVGVAAALLVLVRPRMKARLLDSGDPVVMGSRSYVGRSAEVVDTVSSTGGRVRIEGEEWSARLADDALPMGAGTPVRVVAIDGATAVVAPDLSPQDSENRD